MTSQRHFLSSHPTWRSTSGKSRCFYIICYSMQSGYASMVPIPSRRWCWRHYVFRLSIRCMYEHLCVCVWAEAFPIYLLFTSSFTYIHIYSADVTWELHKKKYCYVYQGNYKCDSWEVLYYKNVLYKQSTHTHACTHTHTRIFNGPLFGTTHMSQYQKAKTNLDFMEQETMSGSGISCRAICKSAPRIRQIDNHASTSPLRFLQARCPSCRPTNSVYALKAVHTSKIK